ncbi:inositol monophosphatase, partial [Staphylococcus aureus]
INTNPKPWDIAAQFLFAELLNLKMTTLDGKAIDHLKGAPFIISNKACHETVLKILNANGGYQKYR